MKKTIAALALAGTMVLSLAACSNDDTPASTPAEDNSVSTPAEGLPEDSVSTPEVSTPEEGAPEDSIPEEVPADDSVADEGGDASLSESATEE